MFNHLSIEIYKVGLLRAELMDIHLEFYYPGKIFKKNKTYYYCRCDFGHCLSSPCQNGGTCTEPHYYCG